MLVTDVPPTRVSLLFENVECGGGFVGYTLHGNRNRPWELITVSPTFVSPEADIASAPQ